MSYVISLCIIDLIIKRVDLVDVNKVVADKILIRYVNSASMVLSIINYIISDETDQYYIGSFQPSLHHLGKKRPFIALLFTTYYTLSCLFSRWALPPPYLKMFIYLAGDLAIFLLILFPFRP